MTNRGRWIVGVDVGGTNIVVGLIPVDGGEVHAVRTLPTEPQRGAKHVVDRMVHMIDHAIEQTLASQGATREDVAGVANIINVLNPEMIVIAGGVTRAGEHLFGPLRSEVRRRAFRSSEEVCQIVPAQLAGTAGVIGAAGVFRTEVLGL